MILLTGCGDDEVLIFSELPASVSVQRTDRYSVCPKTKPAGPIFDEPVLSRGCLEALLLSRQHVMHFLRNPIHLRQISVILAKDENTADLLYGCLKELGLHVKVLSLDGLAKLDEAHLKDRMNELFGTGSSNSFACNFQKYVKQLQWNGAGELPLFVGSFKRSDGLVPNEPMPENSLLALPKGLQLLLQQKSALVQGLQPQLASQMWQLHSLAEHFFLPLDAPLATPIVLADLRGNNFSDDIDVGWTCVWLACSRTECLLTEKASSTSKGKCRGEVLAEQLNCTMAKLRSLMPWKCLPELSSVQTWRATGLEDTSLRPPIWADLIDELDYDVDPHKALEELRSLDATLWDMLDKASRQCGATIALGLMNSLVLNYRAAAKVVTASKNSN